MIKESNIKEYILPKYVILAVVFINSLVFLNVEVLGVYRSYFYWPIPIFIFTILLKGKIKLNTSRNLLYLLFLAIYSLIAVVINDGGIGSALNYVYGFFIFVIFSDYNYKNNDLKKIAFVYIIVITYWILNSNGLYDRVIYFGYRDINPNIIAYLILYMCMFVCITSKKINLKYNAISNMIVVLFSAISIIHLRARGSLIVLFIFVILNYIIPKSYFRKKPKRLFCMSVLVILGGTLFPLIYLYLYRQGVDIRIPYIEKSLYSGREYIWNSFYITMNQSSNWLFGMGSRVELHDIGKADLHNNYLATITNFGLIGYMLYYGFIIKIIHTITKVKVLNNFSIGLLLSYIAILLHGYFEATIYFSPIFIFVFIFLAIAYSESIGRSMT